MYTPVNEQKITSDIFYNFKDASGENTEKHKKAAMKSNL